MKLELTVGETVHILQEEANWYYGYVTTNRNCKGIFPKNYVHIKQCITVDTKGPTPNFAFREPPITHEISSVLREWGYHWKNLYIVSILSTVQFRSLTRITSASNKVTNSKRSRTKSTIC